MPRMLGRVLFSTGRTYSAQINILDFAFVRIPPDSTDLWNQCANGNQLPRADDGGLYKNLISDFSLPDDVTKEEGAEYLRDNRYMEPPKIADLGPLVKGEWYFKIGRTTGVITGICHGTEAYVKLGGTRVRCDGFGVRQGIYTANYTEEWVIMNSRHKNVRTVAKFSDAGDSGSLIIDRMGNAVALLFGYIPGFCGPDNAEAGVGAYYGGETGLVMPMERIEENLRLMTQVKNDDTGVIEKAGATLDVL